MTATSLPKPSAALAATLPLYEHVCAAHPDGILLVDSTGIIVLANPAVTKLLGYEVGELLGMPVDALVPDAVRERHSSYRGVYAVEPKARPMGSAMELSARRRDGSHVTVEIALSPVRHDGRMYVVAAMRGIGDYPRVRQALQRARYSEIVAQIGTLAVHDRDPDALLRQVPDTAAEALGGDSAVVWLLDADRAWLRVAGGVGLPVEELLGSRMANTADTPAGYVLARDMRVTVDDYASETRFSVPAAYLAHGLTSALAVPLADRGEPVGVLAVHSRQRKRFDEDEVNFLQSLASLLTTSLQRARSEAALNHAQRLESVGQLTGGIAHDFNNLLTVIQGNLQVLEDHAALATDAELRQIVAAATRASRRGADLTGKLLAFSRRQVLRPSGVDVVALLASLADMLRRTLDTRIGIEVHTAEQGLTCMVDAAQFESTLLNAAINARDAMPGGGTLAFTSSRCAELPLDVAQELGLAADAREGYVEIAIADTGTGMSEAVRARVFEPFFTTKEAGRGTGLGLSTVYGFVKQSRGAVRLASALGAGTTLTLYLPATAQAAAPPADALAPMPALPAGTRVLLVEDEPEVRSVVRNALQALGCVVTEFGDAEQALASLEYSHAHDLLLTDVALGTGMRGTELVRQVQARWPELGALMMSGFSSDLVVGRTDPAPWELLRKPFDRAELAQALARALAARN